MPDKPMMPQPNDPFVVLGVSQDEDDDALRRAYLNKIKEYPPDRAPSEFERIRDAYGAAKDPKWRAGRILYAVDPMAPLADLIKDDGHKRRFVGLAPWLAALKEE